MIEIFIDNKPAYASSTKELKINYENPTITESGAYTLEVEFPLNIPQNLDVFGQISRIDVRKSRKTFPARILVNGKEVLNGTAILVGVTQESAKVQLVGGNSETNFFYKYEEQYVDELPFGDIDLLAIAVENGADLSASLSKEEQVNAYGGVGISKYYMRVPTYNETADTHLNAYKYYNHDRWQDADPFSEKTKAPSFLWVLRSVLAAMGYKVTQCDYDTLPVQHMYLASGVIMAGADQSISISDAEVLRMTLPHWKIQEFIIQVQDFLNCTIEFLNAGKEVRILRNVPSTRKIRQLAVTDVFSVEINDENDNDTGTIGSTTPYFKNIVEGRKEIWEFFQHRYFDSVGEMVQYAETLSEAERCKTIFETPEYTLYWSKSVNYSVNGQGVWLSLSNYIGEWKGAKRLKELKICPVKILGGGDRGTVSLPVPWNKFVEDTKIWEAIDNGADYGNPLEDKEDAIYLMYVYPGQMTNGGIPWPTGCISVIPDGNAALPNIIPTISEVSEWNFRLHRSAYPEHQFSIGDLFNKALKPQDTVLHRFSFVLEEIPEISDIFLINNKYYLAKKIEFSLKDDGINPLMTGEFYELES